MIPVYLLLFIYLSPIASFPAIFCTNYCTNASEWYEVVNIFLILGYLNLSKKLTPVDVFIQYISTAQTPPGVKENQMNSP
jgi:hypothetical protein